MKKTIAILFLLFNTALFAQQYKYEIRLNNASEAQEIKILQERMFLMFDVMPTYDDSTNTFLIQTDVDMDQVAFAQKIMNEFGLQILTFNKTFLLPEDEKAH